VFYTRLKSQRPHPLAKGPPPARATIGAWALKKLIDRALMQDEFKASHMLSILRSGKDWDWGKKGDFKGLGGRGGAWEIANRVTEKLLDENRMSTKQLFDKIMADSPAS